MSDSCNATRWDSVATNRAHLTRKLADYIEEVSLRESEVLKRLRKASERHPQGRWATGPEQTQFLTLIAQMIGARRVLEVGTFTGYTTLAFALALPQDGRVVTLDLEEAFPAVGRPFWEEAGVAERIELRIGEALGSLDSLLRSPGPGTFDMAYIDCNKKTYDAYYERALQLVRPGGVIAFDNMLWGGAVVDPSDRQKATLALRALSQKLHLDSRVNISLLPIGDGLTLAWKRP
jgi:caffeoyl-CoA O-methyltransferase